MGDGKARKSVGVDNESKKGGQLEAVVEGGSVTTVYLLQLRTRETESVIAIGISQPIL